MGVLRHTEVATRDPDEARAAVSALFCDHTLTPLARASDGVRLSLRADQMGPLSIIHLDYGVPVEIRPQPLGDFFLVQIPRSGAATVIHNGQEVRSQPGIASVLSPTGSVNMTWGADNPQLCVYLSREIVERELSLQLGRPVTDPVLFDPQMPLEQAGNAAWLRSVLFLVDELRRGTSLIQSPEIVASFTATLAGQLLVSQPHNYTELLGRNEPVRAGTVQKAVDFIEAHVGDASLTVPKIASVAGVSVRSLQEAFRREMGATPLEYIKDRRFTIAHHRLRAGDPKVTTVTRVAAGVGVHHLGRFSGEYRQRFGETPSQTLAGR